MLIRRWIITSVLAREAPMGTLNHLRILVVEDDQHMVEFLRAGLSERGHSVVTAGSAEDGHRLVEESVFDAIVLDIGLPGRSGYTIAQYLSSRPHRPAIIMLTALKEEHYMVCGLDVGADDYLTKPFSFPELVARITSATRRARVAAVNILSFGPFQLNTVKRRLFCNHTEIHLSPSEYTLLHALALNRGDIVPRRQLKQAVWGTTAISHGALDTLVNTLREKLSADRAGLISTVRGNGYTLLEEIELCERLAP
jgi:DNA-binding response OmpR family regulator